MPTTPHHVAPHSECELVIVRKVNGYVHTKPARRFKDIHEANWADLQERENNRNDPAEQFTSIIYEITMDGVGGRELARVQKDSFHRDVDEHQIIKQHRKEALTRPPLPDDEPARQIEINRRGLELCQKMLADAHARHDSSKRKGTLLTIGDLGSALATLGNPVQTAGDQYDF